MSERNTRLIYTDRRLSPCASFFHPASKSRGSHDGDVCDAKCGLSPAAQAVSDTCSRPVLFQSHNPFALGLGPTRLHRYLRDSLAPYPQRFSSFFLSFFLSLPFYFGIRLSDPSLRFTPWSPPLVSRVSAGLDLAAVLSNPYADN